jgi:hypothetical protein
MLATRAAGAAALAALFLAATLVDAVCARTLGAPPAAVSLLLATGFVSTAARQVSSLVRMPALARALAAERRALRALLEEGDDREKGGTVVVTV